MIVTCENCQAKFKLNESAMKSESVKVRCTQCQSVFVVSRPKEDEAGEPSLVETDTMSSEQEGMTVDMSPPGESEESSEEASDESDWGLIGSGEEEEEEQAPSEEDSGEADWGTGEKEEATGLVDEYNSKIEELLGGGAGGGGMEDLSASEESSEDAGDEFSGNEFGVKEESGEDFSGNEFGIIDNSGEEDAGEEDAGDEFSGNEFADEEDAADEFAGSEDADEEDASGRGFEFDETPQENDEEAEEVSAPAIASEEAPAPAEQAPPLKVAQAVQAAKVPAVNQRKRRSLLLPLIFIILIGVGVLYYLGILQQYMPSSGPPQKTLEITGLKGFFVQNEDVGELYALKGRVKNISEDAQEVLGVKVTIFDKAGKPLASKTVSLARLISNEELKTFSSEEIERYYRDPSKSSIPSRGATHLMAVFPKPPKGMDELEVEVIR